MASTVVDLHKHAEVPAKRLARPLAMVVALAGVVVLLGVLLAPQLFWDRWVYPYYWAPIVADGADTSQGGISEGYNAISTVTYGILLVIAVALLWRLLLWLRLRYGWGFFARLIPFIVCGSLLRVQEDAAQFRLPVGYLVISPIVYVVVGLLTVGLLVASVFCWRYGRRGRPFGLLLGLWTIAALCAVPLLGPLVQPSGFAYHVPPAAFALSGAAGVGGLLWAWSHGRGLQQLTLFGICGSLLLTWSLLPLMVFGLQGGWPGTPLPADLQMHLLEAPNVIALATVATLVLALGVRALAPTHPLGAAMQRPENLLLSFAHFLDASATYRALELFGYGEKHVVPSALIAATGTAAVMFPLKLIVILLVIYVLDVELREELADNPPLVALIRATVLVLGLAPGLRDLGRLALGV